MTKPLETFLTQPEGNRPMTIKERGRIVAGGMGGFLNPPGHPEHTHSVETDLRRRKENRGGMALSSAVECEYLDDATRAAARTMLESWKRPPLESPDVQDWVFQVLGYFRGCYRKQGNEAANAWHASELEIDQTIDPSTRLDDHAALHLIRRYYPEYVPTAGHFAGAYWGTKTDVLLGNEIKGPVCNPTMKGEGQ